MFASLRSRFENTRFDGAHALLLAAGVGVALMVLQLYANTISYNVLQAPDILQNVLPWMGANIQPEPWEHTLFQAGLFLIPLGGLGFWLVFEHAVLSRTPEKAYATSAAVAVCALGGWLFLLASAHPNALTVLRPVWGEASWSTLFPLTVLSGISVIVAGGATFLRWPAMPSISARWSIILECILLAVILAIICIDPHGLRFSLPMEASDDDWFIVPAHDILHGKHLLVESESQYGLLLPYMLAGIFKIIGLTIAHFHLVLMLAAFMYYVCLYGILRILFPTRTSAILSFIFILGWTYFRNEARSEMYGEPSITRLRNFWDMPLFLAIVLEYKTGKRLWFILACVIASVALLYNTDIGVALALTAMVWTIAQPLFQNLSLRNFATTAAVRLACAGCILLAGILLFSVWLKIVSGSFPDWPRDFYYTKLYLAGFGAMPMPVIGAYWAVLGTYVISILVALFTLVAGRPLKTAPLLLTISAYGVVAFQYYLNRSFIANLWVIAMPAAFCGILLAQAYRQRVRENQFRDTLIHPLVRAPVFFLISLFFGMSLYTTGSSLLLILQRRLAEPAAAAPVDTNMQNSITAITTRIPAQKRVAVISLRESAYLLQADRSSTFDVPILQSIFTINKMQNILQKFADQRHAYLFVEHTYDRCPMCDTIKGALLPLYTLQSTEGFLDIYKRNP
ncbi:MAG: hypothetical protein JWM56_785 [Candidatus Peribacteria bacterium]|nr:hypothetical protein [Candidatus Peribacteria bacterium]